MGLTEHDFWYGIGYILQLGYVAHLVEQGHSTALQPAQVATRQENQTVVAIIVNCPSSNQLTQDGGDHAVHHQTIT
jgi:hypothetical protein